MLLAVIGAVGIVVLTLGTAVFVAAEFSLVAADRTELERLARAGDRSAGRALRAVEQLSFQLSAAQLGITVTTLAVGFIAEPSLTALFDPVVTGLGLSGAAVDTLSVVAALVIATLVQMVIGELVPKNWAIARPTAVSRRVAVPMRLFTVVFGPLISVCNAMANRVVRGLGIEPQEELRSARSAGELESLVRSSAEAGTLPQTVASLLARSLDFDRTAGAVMTPRTRIVGLAADASVADLLATSRSSGHARLPVWSRDDADTLTSVVNVTRAFAVAPDARDATTAASLAVPVPTVPESLRLEPLLRQVRTGPRMAAVIDEWGGLAGIVTLTDIVEELVGDLGDDTERPAAHDEGPPTDDGTVELPGLARLDEAAAAAPGFTAPAGPYEKLAGLMLQRLGRLARPGDTVEVDGWTLTVSRLDGRRIDAVLLRHEAGERR